MEKKQFTITIVTCENGKTEFDTKNEGFEPFELIGILFNVLQKTQMKLNEEAHKNHLEKEMD
jgi:hypothetical protein